MPTIADRGGPLYLRIVSALSDDIAAGRLHQGQLLPTHRTLAAALGVDLTTVTRAYTEARRLGLTEAQVGRGTFVKAGPSQQARQAMSPGIDLSMNLPPQPAEADLTGRLAKAFGELRADIEPRILSQLSAARRHAQRAQHSRRVAAVSRPRRHGRSPHHRARHAVGAVLPAAQSRPFPGDSIFTEALTYPGLKAAAAALGVKLIGVEMDGEGIVPAALERACRRHGEAKVVYLMPTMHNPTTATMPTPRRAQIAQIIRERSLTLIEDDPYAFLTSGIEPLATLVPERAFLTASLSKASHPACAPRSSSFPTRATPCG